MGHSWVSTVQCNSSTLPLSTDTAVSNLWFSMTLSVAKHALGLKNLTPPSLLLRHLRRRIKPMADVKVSPCVACTGKWKCGALASESLGLS